MTKITDMLDQPVGVGDRIVATFRVANRTVPAMRTGTVLAIVRQRSTQQNRGNSPEPEDFLRVEWDASSWTAEVNEIGRKVAERRAARGITQPYPLAVEKVYVSNIMVSLKRFLKIS